MNKTPVALYVHVPFCLSICPYCEFVVYAGRAAKGPHNRIEAFVEAVLREISLRARPGPLRSVYLGGGTPSLLSAAQVGRILSAADRAFGVAPGAEVTIEVNPGPSERGDMGGFRAAGVNRLSIGAQSFDAGELRRLGRRHAADDVRATVRAARAAGFENVSLDLLYDVPRQTVRSWRASLTEAIALQPNHVSAYALTLEATADGAAAADHLPPSAGALRWRARAVAEQDEDRAADMYELAEELLAHAGYEWYEISNWAQPGRESRHNLAYWRGEAWAAVGPGAHAFDGASTRRWNGAQLDTYVEALRDGRLPPGGSDASDGAGTALERAMLKLRTREGLSAGWTGSVEFRMAIARATADRLVERTADGAVRLTLRGRLLSNEVFLGLMPDKSPAAA